MCRHCDGFSRSASSCPEAVRRERRRFFYPGSSLGNFTPDEAQQFLRNVRVAGGDDCAILMGVDW